MKSMNKSKYKKYLLLLPILGSFNFLSANTILNSSIAKGLLRFLKDIGGGLIFFALIIGGVVLTYQLIKGANADDDGDAKEAKKRVKNTIIYTILAILAVPILELILSYFK